MKRGLKVMLVFVISLISFFLDEQIIELMKIIKSKALDEIFLGFTFMASIIVIFFVLTTVFLYHDNKRRWIVPLWLTLLIESIIITIIKIIVKRPRPYIEGTISTLSILASNAHRIWDFSFPSFHAAVVFSAIPFISKDFPKLKVIWIVFGVLTCISRIYFGLHNFTDVIIGASIGYFIGLIILKKEIKYGFGKKIYQKIKNKL